MRSKKLTRQLKKGFANSLDEDKLPELVTWLRSCPAHADRDYAIEIFEGMPEFLNLVEQANVQSEERVEIAQKNLEVSSKELTESNKNLFSLNTTFDAMVNSLGQGFFLFNKEGSCLSVYSKVCETLLEIVPKEILITEVFRIPEDKKAGFLDWSTMLFEDLLEFGELALLGPRFYKHSQGLIIALDYKPVRNKQGEIEAVVVIATDRTKEFDATRKAKELQAYVTIVVSVLKDRPRFLQFVRHARTFFKDMFAHLTASKFEESDLDVVKRHLHTLKGASGSFGMTSIADFTHQLESDILNLKSIPEIQNFLRFRVLELELLFESLLKANREVIGDTDVSGSTREVPLERLESFAQSLFDAEDCKVLFPEFIRTILCLPLSKVMERFNDVVQETALMTNKKVRAVTFIGDDPNIMPEAYGQFWESLAHLFRNMVDHGIEDAVTRKSLSKPEQGQVTVQTLAFEKFGQKYLEIKIFDDGKGIDPEVIRRKMILSGETSAQNLQKEDLLNMIFEAGFSTAKEVTQVSGRGVGLDVVSTCVEKCQGKIHVESDINVGTTFVISLPWLQVAHLKKTA